jgi:hypothetical protein
MSDCQGKSQIECASFENCKRASGSKLSYCRTKKNKQRCKNGTRRNSKTGYCQRRVVRLKPYQVKTYEEKKAHVEYKMELEKHESRDVRQKYFAKHKMSKWHEKKRKIIEKWNVKINKMIDARKRKEAKAEKEKKEAEKRQKKEEEAAAAEAKKVAAEKREAAKKKREEENKKKAVVPLRRSTRKRN